MRAAVLLGPSGSFAIESIPIPEPLAGEVLIRVRACGVCHTDLHVAKGEVAFPTPCVLGHEISGEVVERGDDVENVAVGDRVVCPFIMPCGDCPACAMDRDDLCEKFFSYNRLRGTLYDGTSRLRREDGTVLAMYSMGGLAEYAVVPATGVFRLPDELELEASAILGCALFTAYGAVRRSGGVTRGHRVAVIATGGVGLNIVQLSRAVGAEVVIAIDVSQEKLDAATAAGATHTVNAVEGDPVDRVRELTSGRGVDVAFEVLGRPETFEQAFRMVCDGGTMVPVGIAAGAAVAYVPITHLVRRQIRIVGSYGARTRVDMPAVIDLALRGIVTPAKTITRRVGLEETGAIYAALDRGEITGRAIVIP